MNLITLVAIGLLIYGIVVSWSKDNAKPEPPILGKKTETSLTPTETPVTTFTPTLSNSQQAISPSPAAIPTSFQPTVPEEVAIDLSQFSYPSSNRMRVGSTELILESSDNTETITSWYEEKIKSLGMNAQSFVKTNTNGNVENKLVAGGSGGKISVEITKESGSLSTKITVSHD